MLSVRTAVSLVVNAGTGWAGISVLAGWLVARPLPAAAAGILAALTSLTVHYGLGVVTGLMDPDSFRSNAAWFVVAAIMGAPLGLIGAMAGRVGTWGVLARLVVQLGAVLEPWLLDLLFPPAFHPLPIAVARWAAGIVLTLLGLLGAAVVLRRSRTVE